MVQERPDDECGVNSDNVPSRIAFFDELPCLAFGKGFPRSVNEMRVWISNTFFPRRGIVIFFLKLAPASQAYRIDFPRPHAATNVRNGGHSGGYYNSFYGGELERRFE
jgi:hypothetical protein